MTIQLAAEVGDRVRFKAEGLPDLSHHAGWAGNPDAGQPLEPVIVSWAEHFGGLPALVDCVDIPNQQVRVRGRDRNRQNFTVWIEPQHLEVVQRGMDFGGPDLGT